MSSHLVPALRALLPVAFLCEVRPQYSTITKVTVYVVAAQQRGIYIRTRCR